MVDRARAAELVESLVEKSLVDRVPVGASRFRLFETTAVYAAGLLDEAGEAEAVRDRHLQHFHDVGEPFRSSCFLWDVAALDVLSLERANLVAAFEWAAARGAWQVAGELLRGALVVLLADDRGLLRSIDRTISGLEGDADADAATWLHPHRFWVAVVAADFDEAIRSATALTQSALPLHRVLGTVCSAWLTGFIDSAAAEEMLEDVLDDLAGIPPGDDADTAALAHLMATKDVLLLDGRAAEALTAATAILARSDPAKEDEFSGGAARGSIICHLMLGQPAEALEATHRAGAIRSAFGTAEFHIALAHLGVGDLDAAQRLMRPLARRSAQGRVRLEAASMLLVFAVLAHAEGEEDRARELLLTTSLRRTVDLFTYSEHIAQTLGEGPAYETLARSQPRQDPDWQLVHHRECTAAVRAEMARRGWDGPDDAGPGPLV